MPPGGQYEGGGGVAQAGREHEVRHQGVLRVSWVEMTKVEGYAAGKRRHEVL
jgi:hypothetical protein